MLFLWLTFPISWPQPEQDRLSEHEKWEEYFPAESIFSFAFFDLFNLTSIFACVIFSSVNSIAFDRNFVNSIVVLIMFRWIFRFTYLSAYFTLSIYANCHGIAFEFAKMCSYYHSLKAFQKCLCVNKCTRSQPGVFVHIPWHESERTK